MRRQQRPGDTGRSPRGETQPNKARSCSCSAPQEGQLRANVPRTPGTQSPGCSPNRSARSSTTRGEETTLKKWQRVRRSLHTGPSLEANLPPLRGIISPGKAAAQVLRKPRVLPSTPPAKETTRLILSGAREPTHSLALTPRSQQSQSILWLPQQSTRARTPRLTGYLTQRDRQNRRESLCSRWPGLLKLCKALTNNFPAVQEQQRCGSEGSPGGSPVSHNHGAFLHFSTVSSPPPRFVEKKPHSLTSSKVTAKSPNSLSTDLGTERETRVRAQRRNGRGWVPFFKVEDWCTSLYPSACE